MVLTWQEDFYSDLGWTTLQERSDSEHYSQFLLLLLLNLTIKGGGCFPPISRAKQSTPPTVDNNGGDRPTQLLSTCFSQLRVWLERVYHLRICPFCMKRSGDLEIFCLVAVVAGLNAIFA